MVYSRDDRFGFREFVAKKGAFYLNGKRIRLFGGHCSEGDPIIEQAIGDKNVLKAYLRQLKDTRCNVVRTNFQGVFPPAFYDLADEMGIMVYNNWCWENAGSDCTFDWPAFMPVCLAGIGEWIYQDYNHPSLVMYALSNEFMQETSMAKYLEQAYNYAKGIEKSGRPITASSFCAEAINQVTKPFPTDFVDAHNYRGSYGGGTPYTSANDYNVSVKKKLASLGMSDKPIICFESVWYSGDETAKTRVRSYGSPEQYLEVANIVKMPFLDPSSYVRTIGIREYLRPGGLEKSGAICAKRVAEEFRKGGALEGFAIFWNVPDWLGRVIYQPLFVCADLDGKNVFAGRSLNARLWVINDLPDEKRNLAVHVQILNKDNVVASDARTVKTVAGTTRTTVDYRWAVPGNLATGTYTLKLSLADGKGQTVCENTYDFFVLAQSDNLARVDTTRKVAVYHPLTKARSKVENVLDALHVRYSRIGDVSELPGCDVLIIPEFLADGHQWSDNPRIGTIGKRISEWVGSGGRLITFEQHITGDIPWQRAWQYAKSGPATFVEEVCEDHPAFINLPQQCWDTWKGNRGLITSWSISPLTANVLGGTGTFTNTNPSQVVMTQAEAKVGAGSMFLSTVDAIGRYDQDSAATRYVQNVLSYALTQNPWSKARMAPRGTSLFDLGAGDFFAVDMRKSCNSEFKDDVAEDKKGGWTDQGINDMRTTPLGRNTALGIPFTVIDPARNNAKSCIVLGGGPRPYLPMEAKGIRVDKTAAKLFFFQTMAWCDSPKDTVVAQYLVHYADGKTETIPWKSETNIHDWYGPVDVPEARVAWRGSNLTGAVVGYYVMPWENPRPETKIEAIDFISKGYGVPILIAITGQTTGRR